MTITRPQPGEGPIAFSGQIVAFDHNSTFTEREIVSPNTREIIAPNPDPRNTFYANLATGALPLEQLPTVNGIPSPNGTVQFIQTGTGTNPQQYILKGQKI